MDDTVLRTMEYYRIEQPPNLKSFECHNLVLLTREHKVVDREPTGVPSEYRVKDPVGKS